jgi:antitoxin component HigA of HigAB toxin-antitoxin module
VSTATEYRNLLFKIAPRPIHSERGYDQAISLLERIMVPHPSAALSQVIELLSTLIESYESRSWPTPCSTPANVLRHLLATRGIKNAEVARKTGIPPATLSNVLASRRSISKANSQKLAAFFGVSPLIFFEGQPSASDHDCMEKAAASVAK